eukprot:8414864-Alexandrium_andersonii.AAC.1
MSASLVGSEMCIRDSTRDHHGGRRATTALRPKRYGTDATSHVLQGRMPVSYTHLTLPTICSV